MESALVTTAVPIIHRRQQLLPDVKPERAEFVYVVVMRPHQFLRGLRETQILAGIVGGGADKV